MITIFFADGGKQIIKPSKAFFQPRSKREPSIQQCCADICHDLGGVRYELYNPKKVK